jgi:flagellar hook protein FlgE
MSSSSNISLSGLQAASIDLNVTSNNIANVATTGFKFSRSEFGDIYAISPFGNSPTSVGNGVQIDNVSQQFTQGNFEFTDSSLDMAISGQGFFVVSQNQAGTDRAYSRAGEFRVNADGYIVNNEGRYLQAFPVDATTGNVTSTSLNTTSALILPPSTGAPSATNEVEIGVNLDASSVGLDPALFDPSTSNTYTNSTSSTIFDSLGESHVLTYYFIKDIPGSATNPLPGDINQWQAFTYLDGNPANIDGGTAITHPDPSAVLPATTITQNSVQFNFNTNGTLASSTPANITTTGIPPLNGAAPITLTHDFANNSTTQYASNFSVSTLNPNGFTTGRISGLDISEDGLVRATYTNGISTPIGKIALADFPNSQGLVNVGGTSWSETSTSGGVIAGEAGTGRFGLIQSGALEASNVDLTQQLVNLITAQRNFQANARSIETANTLTQTIIQIR